MVKKLSKEFFCPDMPYEKFLKFGPESLSEAELLAVILRTGTKNCSAVSLAEKILSLSKGKQKGLNALHHISLSELMEIPGIGEVKAVKIKCIGELSKRMARERAEDELRFDLPSTVASYFMEELRHEEKEMILLLSLDSRLHLIEKYVLSIGTVNASLLSPREVFVRALKCQASSVILLHNHPSGDATPSREDLLVTGKIKETGELVEIPLIDHIIIGDGCYTSLKEKNLL
ncbi:MAG: DNA repair protein RadC [Lachnospiraceae bacterium]|nr:DNA repair protein RadC [Lachnospiraceae bacterium]MCI7190336.1 DNA repair protein RadC [Lachnospiraceae bacterium]MDD7628209.1 DNA repair protein RadC [Lachnospiraceae bacterium]MDY4118198.1 DNA repair protein RadC [Lachnospiraceae bacterium]